MKEEKQFASLHLLVTPLMTGLQAERKETARRWFITRDKRAGFVGTSFHKTFRGKPTRLPIMSKGQWASLHLLAAPQMQGLQAALEERLALCPGPGPEYPGSHHCLERGINDDK